MQFRQLHDAFGAEVIGFDLDATPSADEIEELRQAYDRYYFLLFRSQKAIHPDRQVEMVGWFGHILAEGEKRWSVLDNDDAAGRIQLQFHSDFTYTDYPIKGISLHAIAVPDGGTTTSYVSGVNAWKTLSKAQQTRVRDRSARHIHVSIVTAEWPEFVADHPVCLIHPRTHEPVLFVTEHHARRIEGLDAEESDQLLHELFDHLYDPGQIYVHDWQLYDLIIWDNLGIQHARRDEAKPRQGRRTLQRVTIQDKGMGELIEVAREAERQRELQIR